jgi:hypothetical protein
MVALWSVATLSFSAGTRAQPQATITLEPTKQPGSFDLLIGGKLWFPAGAPTSMRHKGTVYSVADGSLKLRRNTQPESGSDTLGTFERTSWLWSANVFPSGLAFETATRVYKTAVVFEQTWIGGAVDSSAHDKENLISTFPSFGMPAADTAAAGSSAPPPRGYLQYHGDMVGSGYHIGKFDRNSDGIGSGVSGTAPLCIFAQDMATSAVLSPYSNFMAVSQHYADHAISYGLMGNITQVPAGYKAEVVLVVGGGVTDAMFAWGDALLSTYGKQREAAWQKDFTLKRLGYSTDNGAYYYYNTEKGMNYEDTMLGVAKYAAEANIPYRYWLADSWWYFKGVGNGVYNWTAMPSIFPHGMAGVYDATSWLVQGHNRYWSADTNYAKQNGGKWNFLVDNSSGYALPYDQAFWNYLMSSSKKWGLTV